MLILRTRCCKKLKQKWQYHNRKVSNVALTDIFKTNRIQCLPLQNIYSKAIAESTGLCRRSTCLDQSSAGTVRQTIYRRPLGLPSHRTHHLEHPAGRFDLCSVPSLSTFRQRVKIFLFQASFPHYHRFQLNYAHTGTFSRSWSDFYLDHYKNVWLIDWYCE